MLRTLLLSAALGACAQAAPPPDFDGELALERVRTQVDFGPRIPGTEGHRRAGDWIEQMLRERADTVLVQAWQHATADGDTLPLRNFLGRWRPEAPRRLLFLAHWDTRPRADAGGSRDRAAPVPGANDGASGVAVLLGVADALRAQPPGVGVDILFVDAEDYGTFPDRDVLLGSTYYAENPPPGPRPAYAVVLDMVGGTDARFYHETYSMTGAPDIVELVWDAAAGLGYDTVFIPESRHTVTDDHLPLQRVGIKAIDVIDLDYPSWHTPEDTPDKLSARTLAIVGQVVLQLIRQDRGG